MLMARRLLAQSVLGGVFGRWIAFTEEVRRPPSPRASGGVSCLWSVASAYYVGSIEMAGWCNSATLRGNASSPT